MRIWSQCFPLIVCSAFVSVGVSAAQAPAEHVWDYGGARGPSHWGDLKPEFAPCKIGHRQSPIDIRKLRNTDLPPLEFDYKPSPLHIIDNGHTIMINYASGSYLKLGDRSFELKQFHFHRPSEEKINGKGYDMVVHLVHANQQGMLAVIAVLLQQGQDNPLVRELWKDLPKEKGKEEVREKVQIDMNGLLPADRGYYTFDGSLTTPPCTEGVTWFVLKQPMTVSLKEIEQFSKLYRNNARPTQPSYGRAVLETK